MTEAEWGILLTIGLVIVVALVALILMQAIDLLVDIIDMRRDNPDGSHRRKRRRDNRGRFKK